MDRKSIYTARKRRPRRLTGMALLLAAAAGLGATVGALSLYPARAAEERTAGAGGPETILISSQTFEEAQDGAAGADKDAWSLILVNPWNPLPEDYELTLTELQNGQAVDERCYPDLQEMMDDCRAAGLSPLICSSYRTQETQQALFDNKVQRLLEEGYSQSDAVTEAGKVVAVPGTSEHQLGLAVDIVDMNNQNLDETQEDTEVQQWLMENSWKYGFILRYPNDKSELTGIIYEPWHYRYVGRDAAQEIYEAGLCLEEYLAQ